jgi:hypothetical protein
MKLVIVICAALSFAIGSPSHADAQSSAKHKGKKHTARSTSSTTGGYQGSSSARGAAAAGSGWYPHDSSQLPFGSKQWWDQKARESGGDHN